MGKEIGELVIVRFVGTVTVRRWPTDQDRDVFRSAKDTIVFPSDFEMTIIVQDEEDNSNEQETDR